MFRTTVLILFLLLVWGCESRPGALSHPGPNSAFAAVESDTAVAITRRLWAGPDADRSLLYKIIGTAPDGRSILFNDDVTGDIVIRDLTSGEVRNITRNATPYEAGFGIAPRVSRDGTRVVFTWWPRGGSSIQLRMADLDGSNIKVIYDASYQPGVSRFVGAEDWSSDGRAILAVRTNDDGTNQIVLIPTDSGAVRLLKTLDWRAPQRVNFSPDGRYIVYDFPTKDDSNDDRDLFALELRTGRELRLMEHPANDYLLGWAPDNRHVLFASDRSGTPGAWLLPVQDGRPAGEPVLVKPDLWSTSGLGFAMDGSYLFQVDTGNRGLYIAEMDPNTGKVVGAPSAITPGNLRRVLYPEWSPDGKLLAFLTPSDRGESFIAAIRSMETGEVREFPIPSRLGGYPVHQWARDGRGLFVSGLDRGQAAIFRMDAQSGQISTVFRLSSGGMGGYTVSPDGGTIVHRKTRTDGVDLIARNLATGEERVIHSSNVAAGIRGPVQSPDGSMVAFMDMARRSSTEGYLTVMVVPVSGGEPRPVATGFTATLHLQGRDRTGGITWSSDGQAVYAVGHPAGNRGPADANANPVLQLWRLPLDGSQPEPSGIAMEQLGNPRFHPEGRRIAFTGGTRGTELWVMQNIVASTNTNARAR